MPTGALSCFKQHLFRKNNIHGPQWPVLKIQSVAVTNRTFLNAEILNINSYQNCLPHIDASPLMISNLDFH